MGRRLGQDKSLIDRRLPFRLYRQLFGSEDMHSHFRWDAVGQLVDLSADRTLEVGGGDGRIGFEVARSGHGGELVITELDPRTLEEARRTAELAELRNVTVSRLDLLELRDVEPFSQVLVIDVLEHIEDDVAALKLVRGVLAEHGRVVISVPTPRYPDVFGRAFHNHLGHVRDGYWLEDLQAKLRATGFEVVEHRYYTGRWVSRACRLFYGLGVPYVIGVLWSPLARPLLRRTESHVSAEQAASLALVARAA